MKFEICVALPMRVHPEWVYFSLIDYHPSRVEQDIYIYIYIYSQVKNNMHAVYIILCFLLKIARYLFVVKEKFSCSSCSIPCSAFRVLDDAILKKKIRSTGSCEHMNLVQQSTATAVIMHIQYVQI